MEFHRKKKNSKNKTKYQKSPHSKPLENKKMKDSTITLVVVMICCILGIYYLIIKDESSTQLMVKATFIFLGFFVIFLFLELRIKEKEKEEKNNEKIRRKLKWD